MLVLALARSEYILRRETIIALGNSGKRFSISENRALSDFRLRYRPKAEEDFCVQLFQYRTVRALNGALGIPSIISRV